jgi:hypothetical protein
MVVTSLKLFRTRGALPAILAAVAIARRSPALDLGKT